MSGIYVAAMPDLADLRAVVRSQTLVEADDVSEATLNLFLNQGYRELSVAFPWPWLQAEATISTVADQSAYSLPTDYRKLFSVADEDATRTLHRLTPEEALNRWGGNPPSGDEARWYYVWADSIFLLPVPSSAETGAYRLYYQKSLTVLSADGDTPEFAEEFHLILTHYAIARAWEHEEDFPKAEAADSKFRQATEWMARYYLRREEHTPLIYGEGIRPRLASNVNMPWLDGA